MKVTTAVVNALVTEGASHVFMVPGGFVDPFTDELSKRKDIKTIISAHEAGAVAMADGYARASGKFGAMICIGGPGITNTITNVYTAYMDQIPLFIVSGEVRTEWEGRGFIQDTSPNGPVHDGAILKNITAMTRSLRESTNFDFHIRGLFKKMNAPSSRGPVHLALPLNVQLSEVAYEHQPTSYAYKKPHAIDLDSCKDVADLIAQNTKIAIVCGWGAHDADTAEELIRFSEKYSLPIATTLSAKGTFPEDHINSLGCFGWAGLRPAIEAILSDDLEVLIVLGSKMNMQDTMFWNERFKRLKALIQVDVNENSIGQHFPTHHPVISDCLAFLQYMDQRLQAQLDHLQAQISERKNWITTLQMKSPRMFHLDSTENNLMPIHPGQVIRELRKVMPRNTILTVDNGAHSFFTGHYWEAYKPREFLSALRYVGDMGWAIGAGIGAKFAKPDHPSVVVTGDGCMLMHGMEVQTAARYNLDMIFVILNNSAFGNPYLRAKKVGPEVAAMQILPTHDWCAFAQSMGAKGIKVERPEELVPAFQRALNEGGTQVINVIAGNYPTPTENFDKVLLSSLRKLD